MTLLNDARRDAAVPGASDSCAATDRPARVYSGDIYALGEKVVREIQPTLDMQAAYDRGLAVEQGEQTGDR